MTIYFSCENCKKYIKEKETDYIFGVGKVCKECSKKMREKGERGEKNG